MSKKEKLISLIVLVCLVLLVTVIGYQKYHENIRPTKESSPASTVETEPISSQKEEHQSKKTPTEQYVVYFKKSSVFHFM